MGTARISEVAQDGIYCRVQLTLSDGRQVYFHRRMADLEAGGPSPRAGDNVELRGSSRLPTSVHFAGRVLFESQNWWAGPPPPRSPRQLVCRGRIER